jgi:transposase
MTRRRKKHRPDEIVAKLRDADAMLNAGKDLAAVLQALEVSDSTLERWRAQYGGMKCEEAKKLKHLEDENRRLKQLVVKRMLQLARARPRCGYRRIGWLLREEGWQAGLSRVFRLWQREGLKVPVKKRKRRRIGTSANGCHRRRTEGPNDVWCWDFVYDRTVSGSQLKWLSVVDEYTRECLALKVDRGFIRSANPMAVVGAHRCDANPNQ